MRNDRGRRHDLFLVRSEIIDMACAASFAKPEGVAQSRRPGAFGDELGLLTGQAMLLTARTRQTGSVVRIGVAQFRQVVREHVDVGDVLVEAFERCRRCLLGSTDDLLEVVADSSAPANRTVRVFMARVKVPHAVPDAGSPARRTATAGEGHAADDRAAAVVAERVLRRLVPDDVADVVSLVSSAPGHPPSAWVVPSLALAPALPAR